MAKFIKQYRFVQYDDGVVTSEIVVGKDDFESIGRMMQNYIGELTRHVYEEYTDGTRLEMFLGEEKLYNYISKNDDVYCLIQDTFIPLA